MSQRTTTTTAGARPALRVVEGTAEGGGIAPRPGPSGRPAATAEGAPVLVGLLACAGGGEVMGVVREVLGWDGERLRLRLTLAPGDGPTEIEVALPCAAARGTPAGRPKAV